jgi:hypothetical protein
MRRRVDPPKGKKDQMAVRDSADDKSKPVPDHSRVSTSALQSSCRTTLIVTAPILLCIVALAQRYMIGAHDLTRWKGGGFGMFSTPLVTRMTTVNFVATNGESMRLRTSVIGQLSTNPIIQKDCASLTSFPTKTTMSRLGHEILRDGWVLVRVTDDDRSGRRSGTSNDDSNLHRVEIAGQTGSLICLPFDRLTDYGASEQIPVAKVSVEAWEYQPADEPSTLQLVSLGTLAVDAGHDE